MSSTAAKSKPRWRVKRITLAGLPLMLLLAVSLLLFTHSGNVLLWRQVVRALPALNGELVRGELQNGWRFENVSWQDPQVAFTASAVTLDWQPVRLLTTLFSTRELPVQLLAVEGGRLTVHPSQEQTEPANTKLDIPLALEVQRLDIIDFQFATTGTDVALGSLSASVRLQDNRLHIQQVLADNLMVQLAAADDNPPASKAPASIDLSSIRLPTVNLPLPIELDQLTLTNAQYRQGEISEEIRRFSLGFHWQGTRVSQLRVAVQQSRGRAQLDGEIDLTGHYPLNLNAEVALLDDFAMPELAPLKGQALTVQASGDLAGLTLKLTTEGAVHASLQGRIGLFAPGLPLNLQLQWSQLGWPLSEPQFTASDGSLTLGGTINDYRLALDTVVKVAKQPASHLALESSGTLERLTVDQLLLRPDDARQSLLLTGTLGWRDGIHWQGQAQLSQLETALWLPTVPGVLNGRVSTHFALQGSQWQLNVPDLDITGTVHDKNLRASGRLEVNNRIEPGAALPVSVNVQNLHLSLGQNRVDISGQIARQLSLQAKVNAPALAAVLPQLHGAIEGDVRLDGDYQQPSVSFSFASPVIELQEVRASGIKVAGELRKTEQIVGNLKVQIDTIDQGGVEVRDLLLTASGDERQHRVALQTEGEPINLQLLINGAWLGGKSGLWQGELASAAIGTPIDRWSLVKPLAVAVDAAGEATLSDQCWQAGKARLCVDATKVSPGAGTARVQLSDFHLASLKPFLPRELDWQAVLSGSGNVRWDGSSPSLDLQVESTPGVITHNGETPLTVRYQQLASVIRLQDHDLTARFDLVSEQLGNTRINLTVKDTQKEQVLTGRAQLENVRLNYLQPLIPDLRSIGGTLSADTRLGGTLTSPLLFGQVQLSEGQLVARQDMVHVSNLVTRLDMTGSKGQLSGSMNVGKGVMKLSGHLDWQQLPPTGVIDIDGQNLAANIPGIVQLRASPQLQMSLGSSQILTGKITIPWARVIIKELPRQAVRPSPDVLVVTPGSEQHHVQQGSPFAMDVDVVLGDDIKMDAYGLKAELAGQLQLGLQPQKPLEANGSIQLLNGRYHQFGQDLVIQEGNIVFSGPLSSPYLSVNAIRNPESIAGKDVTVGIRVSGLPSQPDFSIYSDPTMPQQEQWSYLLRGRPLDSDGDDSSMQSVLVDLGVSQIGGAVSSLGEKIGLSEVTLDTEGSGDDTQVTIGGNIAPGLRLQYGAGVFNSIAEVKVRYELLPRLYVQAVSGLAQAIDLFYQFRIETDKE